MVFYCISLLYTVLALVAIIRTWDRLFKCQKFKNKDPMKVWRGFYGFLWIYIALNLALYWTYFGEFVDNDVSQSSSLGLLLFYIPAILTSLSYALLYYQMIDM